jgi:DMSO/TMAO reductase YedYZ molybdopterin-dependent catalytic subunit
MSLTEPERAKLADLKPELVSMERRLFLRGSLSLGALTMLTGCNLTGDGAIDSALRAMSRWNDRVQAWMFNPDKLAPTYTKADVTRPFPFNGFYRASRAPAVDGDAYRLEIAGLVAERRPWSIGDLRALPQESQITRLICVEGWSAIGEWSGVRLGAFLKRIGADTRARYVGFKCADGYYSSIDMATALHPQTILALDFGGNELPRHFGYPMRLRMPTKLGFKNPKHIAALFVTNDYPGGYWEDQGYNWFSGS